ncbi:glycine-rich domain-containing protein [Sphingomonas sp. PB4P5]|uniref:glycine-rich domain-containing protein n=1 Tax=Parasphingomonas puruogangriensis TaxID=3096155 RepID=UPI002FCC7F0B
MTPAHAALWTKIAALAIDPPGARLTFVSRLADENDWDAAYAAAVVHEYRRFLFLAATGTRAVTPSDAVDQAWHLHLAYTRSYWDDLCGGVLGRPLHHGPTAGGGQERARYRAQYIATLATYETAFGMAPPPAIWPPAEQRFAARFVRADRDLVWLVPKRAAWVTVAAPAAGVALIAAAGGDAFGFIAPLVAVAILAAMAVRFIRQYGQDNQRGKRDGSGCGSSCGSSGHDGDSGCGGHSDGGGGDSGGGGGCGGGGD